MTLRTEAGDSVIGERAAQIARADRLAGGEIGLDDALEDFARALVELAERGGGLGGRPRFVGVGMAHDLANLGTRARTSNRNPWAGCVGVKAPRAA